MARWRPNEKLTAVGLVAESTRSISARIAPNGDGRRQIAVWDHRHGVRTDDDLGSALEGLPDGVGIGIIVEIDVPIAVQVVHFDFCGFQREDFSVDEKFRLRLVVCFVHSAGSHQEQFEKSISTATRKSKET